MYAVVRTGGKQVRVSPGEAVWVEKLPGEIGEQVNLDEVLLLGGEGEPQIGAPQVPGARVVATITGQGLGEKLVVFKYTRRTRDRRQQGHRQRYTHIRVDRIEA
jgi:large subunit ribosomal protein L21